MKKILLAWLILFALMIAKCKAQEKQKGFLSGKDWVEFNKQLNSKAPKTNAQMDAELAATENNVINAFRNGTKLQLDSAEILFRIAVKHWQEFYFDIDTVIVLTPKKKKK